jgi:hypothetical protein
MEFAKRPHGSAHDLRIAMHKQNKDTGEKKRSTHLQKENVYCTTETGSKFQNSVVFFWSDGDDLPCPYALLQEEYRTNRFQRFTTHNPPAKSLAPASKHYRSQDRDTC